VFSWAPPMISRVMIWQTFKDFFIDG